MKKALTINARAKNAPNLPVINLSLNVSRHFD